MDLQGFERYSVDGLPVPSADVERWDAVAGTPAGAADDATTTDADGKWDFPGLADGLYDIKVTKSGRVRWYKGLIDWAIRSLYVRDSLRIGGGFDAPGMHRSFLTNGGFEVWQRGAGPFTTDSAHCADAWRISEGVGSTISVSRGSSSTDVDTAIGGQYAAVVTYTHSSDSIIQQIVEDAALYAKGGREVTFSMRVKADAANAVRLQIIDSDGSTLLGSSSYHTGGGDWETLELTVTSTAVTGKHLYVRARFEASGTFQLDNAMLVMGGSAGSYVPLHPADDLARCQRYYQTGYGRLYGYGSASQAAGMSISFMTQMALTPTVVVADNASSNIVPGVAALITVDQFFLSGTVTVLGSFDLNATWTAEALLT